MVTSLQSRAEGIAESVATVRTAKPALLMAVYANADVYLPTVAAARILAHQFKVTMVSRNTDESYLDWPNDIEVERIGSPLPTRILETASPISKARGFLRYLRELRRAWSRTSPRVIYAYDPIALAAIMMLKSTAPVIFQCHDAPALESLPLRSLQTWLIKYALRRTGDAAVVVFPEPNRATYWLNAAGSRQEAIIVPNGAPRDFFKPDRDWCDLALERWKACRAFYLSSMGLENGQLEAIDACSSASVFLDLAGRSSPQFRARLEQRVIANDAAARIVIHGRVDNATRMQLLREASVGLLLYKPVSKNWEFSGSASTKLFEYAAAGLPVIVPDRRSYREFLDGEEWITFVDIDNPRSIAAGLNSILADRDRYVTMSRAARAAHEQRLNYELLFEPVRVRIAELAGRA